MEIDAVKPEYFEEGSPAVLEVIIKINQANSAFHRFRDQRNFSLGQASAHMILGEDNARTAR